MATRPSYYGEITKELEEASIKGLTSFESAFPCVTCGHTRRNINKGDCMHCDNARAKLNYRRRQNELT